MTTPNPTGSVNQPEPTSPVDNTEEKKEELAQNAKPDQVAYSTYRKTLAEAKKAKETARQYEAKLKEILEEKNNVSDEILKKNQQWAQLVESKENKIKELLNVKEEFDGFKSKLAEQEIYDKKRQAIFKSFKHPIKNKFADIIDVSSVAIDPETNEVDYDSAFKVAEEYQKVMPEIFETKGMINMPSGVPVSNQNKITYDQWLKLSVKDKINKRPLIE